MIDIKSHVKGAFGIYIVYVLTFAIGIMYWKHYTFGYVLLVLLLKGVLIFIFSLFGLAFSKELDFEPLSLARNIKNVKKVGIWIGTTFIMFVIITFVASITSMVMYPISTNILHETFPSESFFETHFEGPPFFAVFLLLFAGAGIAEEVLFRLFAVNVIWYYTKNAKIAIVVSSIIFGLYHLTPLNSLHEIFWEYPFFQVTTCTIAGILLAYTYKKLGFESVVIIHTFLNIF
ncbi:MAG: CPBP family intramembrane metalloprotease [Theionarchaea archaeon]|nr:CPBP family intramembrane metalloprotease [Theionarchaea archaeon]